MLLRVANLTLRRKEKNGKGSRFDPYHICFVTKDLACEQAVLFGRVKRVSRERASERPLARAFSRGSLRFARRACSQATKD